MLATGAEPGYSVGPADRGNGKLPEEQLYAVDLIVEKQLDCTWTEIAEELGVTKMTLWRWRQRPEFQAELAKRTRNYCREHLPTGYRSLIRNVEKGKETSLKLFFELTGELQEAKLRELFGTWMAYLAIAGKANIRQLVGLVREAQEAQGGAIPAEAVVVPVAAEDRGEDEQEGEDRGPLEI